MESREPISESDLLLISAVISSVADEQGFGHTPCMAMSRRLFKLVECGERDFEKLKQAAQEMHSDDVKPPEAVQAVSSRSSREA